MKSLILSISFLLCVTACLGQWSYRAYKKKNFLYTSGDYIVGKNNGGTVGLNYIINSKYSFSVGYSATDKEKSPLPNDFLKSVAEPIAYEHLKPFQNAENFHFMAGRIFNLSRKNSVRLLVQAGPALTNSKWPDFYQKENYLDYKMESTKNLSLILNPKLEIPVSTTLGFSAGPMFIVNKNQNYFGAGIGLMYGIVDN